jgi:hypothetical protein
LRVYVDQLSPAQAARLAEALAGVSSEVVP